MPLLIRGSVVTPVNNRRYEVLPDTYTYVTSDGIIRAVQELRPGVEPLTEEEFLRNVGHNGELEILRLKKGEFLIPGFVDTHTVRVPDRHSDTIDRTRDVLLYHSMPLNSQILERVRITNYCSGSIKSLSRWKPSSRT